MMKRRWSSSPNVIFLSLVVLGLLLLLLTLMLGMTTFCLSSNNNNNDVEETTRFTGSNEYSGYRETLCRIDADRVQQMEKVEPFAIESLDTFHKMIQEPLVTACIDLKPLGGNYWKLCKLHNGHKFTCMDDILPDVINNECLVYSFGISDDWTFESVIGNIGCRVLAHDPTVDLPERLAHNVRFEKVGVAATKSDGGTSKMKLDTLAAILARNNHTDTKISMLKMDVEGSELDGLDVWLESGALRNVQQFAMEIHLEEDMAMTQKFLRTLQRLYFEGNFRLISYEPNACTKYQEQMRWNADEQDHREPPHFNYAEIVLKKLPSNLIRDRGWSRRTLTPVSEFCDSKRVLVRNHDHFYETFPKLTRKTLAATGREAGAA